MRLLITVIIVLSCFAQNLLAHKEWVHQYILKEAYRFLELELQKHDPMRILKPIPPFRRQIRKTQGGTLDSPDGRFYRPVDIAPSATIAIYREDNFDAVYGNTGFNKSDQHFWTPAKGMFSQVNLGFPYGDINGNSPNAFDKASAYIFGRPFSGYWPQGCFGVEGNFQIEYFGNETIAKYITYSSVFDLYKTGNANLHGYKTSTGTSVDLRNPKNITLTPSERELYAMHFLGRAAHLLTDMSVPAHTHEDAHPCDFGNGDTFELEMGDDLGVFKDCNDFHSSFPAMEWTAETAMNDDIVGGGFLFPDEILQRGGGYDILILKDLFYTMNQLADFFPSSAYSYSSSGVGALVTFLLGVPLSAFNPYIPQESGNLTLNSAEQSELISFNLRNVYNQIFQQYGANPFANYNPLWYSDFYKIRGKILINYAIRATATLLYWFMQRTGIQAGFEADRFIVEIDGSPLLRPGKTGHYFVRIGDTGLNDPEWFSPSQAQYTWTILYKYADQTRNRYVTSTGSPDVDVVMDDADEVIVNIAVGSSNPAAAVGHAEVSVTRYLRPSPTILASAKAASIQSAAVKPTLRSSKFSANDFTMLSYTLPSDNHVQLEVLNAQYQKVAQLVSGIQNTGKYEERFDVASLPVGTYIVRMTATNQATGEQVKEAAPLYVQRK